jgi:hypothetical protein
MPETRALIGRPKIRGILNFQRDETGGLLTLMGFQEDRIMRARKAQTRRQSGQMLLVAALSMAVLLGFTAMAIDVGMAYQDRRDLQNDADAAALAGAQHLPTNPTAAEDAAADWLTKNGIDSTQVTDVSVESTLVANDTIRVEVDDDFGWVFARVLGMTTSNIGAQAKARVGSLEGNSNMMPWAVIQGDTDCLDSNGDAVYGTDCTVKVGASDGINGWNGALDFDGNGGGSSEYESNIVDGTVETIYCAAGDFNEPCPGTTMIHDLDGNKVGGTGHGIDERLTQGPDCDSNGNGKDDFSEVFATDPTGINDYIVTCPTSPNVIVIPIVAYDSTPVQQVEIQGWTLAYLNYYGCSSASAVPIGNGDFVFAYDDVRVVASETCEKKAPRNTAMVPPQIASAEDLYVSDPLAGPLPAPNACHAGSPHGQQQCTPSPSPTPSPTPTPSNTPTPTPGATATPSPTPGSSTPTPSPTPAPAGSCNGKGHWEVHIIPVDASYSQINGYSGAYDADKGITIRRLVE